VGTILPETRFARLDGLHQRGTGLSDPIPTAPRFEGRGTHTLRGVPGDRRVAAVVG
jgi:hypothetical protein